MLVLNARMRFVDQIAFGHDGRLYAAGTLHSAHCSKRDNRGIDVWELPAAHPFTHFFHDRIVYGFALNPAGRWLYASAARDATSGPGDRASDYYAIDMASGQAVSLGLLPWDGFRLAIDPLGEWFIGFGFVKDWKSRRIIRWRQPVSEPPVQEWEKTPDSKVEWCWQMVCEPARSSVIALEFSRTATSIHDRALVVRSVTDWTMTRKTSVAAQVVEQLKIAPDGSRLVARNAAALLAWDAHDFACAPQKVRGGKLHFTGIAFHPSGKYLAATSNDKTVKLYDTTTWQVARTYTWEIGRMRSIAFSPDGTLAAAGSDSGKVVVWDVDL
jgi:WD40 repeat protein